MKICRDFEEFDFAPTIKDSGERTEFESGAVRDMKAGKGRCDLVPLNIVENLLLGDGVIHDLYRFQQQNDIAYLYYALDEFCNKRYEGDKIQMVLEVSKHFEEGAKKYGEYNWQKGIPTWSYLDSATRHYLKWVDGQTDEPHDRAFVWNMMCLLWTISPDVTE